MADLLPLGAQLSAQTPKYLSSLGTKEALTPPIFPLGSSVGYVSFLRAVTGVVAQLS